MSKMNKSERIGVVAGLATLTSLLFEHKTSTGVGLSLKRFTGIMRIKPIFAWYDLWVGAFWDQKKRRLYVFLVPCLGLVFDFSELEEP